MIKLVLTIMLLIVFITTPTVNTKAAQTKDYLKEVYNDFEKYGSASLPYRLFVPEDYDSEKEYPLVIFLHGAGERGYDNERQITFGLTPTKRLISKSNLEKYPCIILASQCPSDKRWVETDWGKGNYIQDNIPISTPASMLMDVIDIVINKYNIDEKRLYITGLSMGGFGTWDLITRYPNKFAAAAPICGGADPSKAELIKDTPIWTFHGDKDDIVPIEGTRKMVEALKQAGSTVITYTEYPGVGHGCWDNAYATKGFFDWMFAQELQIKAPEDTLDDTSVPSSREQKEGNQIVFYVIIAAIVALFISLIIFLLKNKKS